MTSWYIDLEFWGKLRKKYKNIEDSSSDLNQVPPQYKSRTMILNDTPYCTHVLLISIKSTSEPKIYFWQARWRSYDEMPECQNYTLALVTDMHHHTERSFVDEFRWVSSLRYLKYGWENAVLLWCMLQAGPPSLQYYCAVVLHSCIVLQPAGHSSNHEHHCCHYKKIELCFEFLSHF